jgi:hypothetical protein
MVSQKAHLISNMATFIANHPSPQNGLQVMILFVLGMRIFG